MIYFIFSEIANKVRIGVHPDPWMMLRQMQQHHEGTCMLMATKDGGVPRLEIIKKKFAKEQVKGAWYRCSTRMEEFIYNHEHARLVAEPLRQISFREGEQIIGISRSTIARWMKRNGIETLTNHNIFDAEHDYYGRNAKAERYEKAVHSVQRADV